MTTPRQQFWREKLSGAVAGVEEEGEERKRMVKEMLGRRKRDRLVDEYGDEGARNMERCLKVNEQF